MTDPGATLADAFRGRYALDRGLGRGGMATVYLARDSSSDRLVAIKYAEDGSLRARLQQKGRLAIPEAVRLASEVAAALDHAHRRDVVHRDVKPENILLSGDRVLVADFGIAKLLASPEADKLTQTGLSLDTPRQASLRPQRRRSESDRGIEVLQTSALPLSYRTGDSKRNAGQRLLHSAASTLLWPTGSVGELSGSQRGAGTQIRDAWGWLGQLTRRGR